MTARPCDDENPLLLRLSEEITRIAAALAELSDKHEPTRQGPEPAATGATPGNSGSSVDFVIRLRRERARYFPSDLFAEPAWDIMLDLLRSEMRDEHVTISDLCLAAGVPTTTALRWITAMVQRGMLVRERDPLDGRRTFIRLAAETSASLRRYFAEIVEAVSIWGAQ